MNLPPMKTRGTERPPASEWMHQSQRPEYAEPETWGKILELDMPRVLQDDELSAEAASDDLPVISFR